MKKCKQGYYYCYTDKKCKRIPMGYRVASSGYLRKENGEDSGENGENGENTNGNGNGGNGNGGGVSESKSGDSSLRDWFGKSRSSDGKPGWVQLGGKYAGKPCAKQPGQTTKPKCGSSKMKRNLDKDEERAAFNRKQRQDPNPDRKGKAINVKTEETVIEKAGEKDACYKKVKSRYSVWPSAYASGALVKCRKVGAANWGNKSESVEYSDWRNDFQATEYEFTDIIKPEPIKGGQEQIDEGQKCWKGYEKKGTKKMFGKVVNNCVKKEEFVDEAKHTATKSDLESKVGGGNLKKLVVKAVKRIDYDVDGDVDPNDKVEKKTGDYGEELPTPFGKFKTKIKKEEFSDWRNELDEGWKSALAGAGVAAALMSQGGQKAPDKKTTTSPSRSNTEIVSKTTQKKLSPMDQWRKNHPKLANKSDNPPKFKRKKLSPINNDWKEANPKLAEKEKDNRSKLGEGAAWTKKSGKNKKGGLNEKGRKSYEAENPGSDLKAPSKKVGNKRRTSFCARMKGMKKKLTSKKTASDPDSRINKSLRAWNC
jgi:hypothetical protein